MASIMKRPDRPKPWLVIWREPDTKQQRARAFDTKKKAEDFRDTVSTDIRHGTYVSPKPVPFKDYATDWLARKEPSVRATTFALYKSLLNLHLIPAFGLIPIQGLRAERIERWTAETLKAGKVGTRTVQIARVVLRQVLRDARRKGVIYDNPMERVTALKVPERELRYLTPEQLRDLCREAGEVYGTIFLTMGSTGLRRGEVLGLQWGDVDFERGVLSVRRQVVRAKPTNGQPCWAFAELKSRAARRVVEIPAGLVSFLVAHRERQNGHPNPHGLVFPSEVGSPLDGRNLSQRYFRATLRRLGLPDVRLHDLRRTFVALHVQAGTHPKLVQARLGHTNIALTMDTYGRLAGDIAMGAEETARFNGLVTKALPEPVSIGQHERPKRPKKALTGVNSGVA